MIKKILTDAGLVENETFREARFPSPPSKSYAVYFDEIELDGSDDLTKVIITHDYTVELYEPAPDAATEKAIENAIRAQGLRFTKQARYWLQDEQRYQVIYELTHREKR